jgi:hypothetical protein
MEAPLTISCPNFWTSLVLKSILEERGVLVQPAQENVFLTLTVSGPLDAIKTAADELQSKYPHSSPIHIEGLEPVPSTLPSTNGAHADPPPSSVPQRCASTTASGSECKLPAVPGGTKCAIHTSTREDWHRELPQL